MNVLALDTATEQCSVALLGDTKRCERAVPTARSHADLILSMIEALLTEAGCTLADVDALAFGRGPGSFTGVRIGVSVAQGLALSRGLPLIGVSNLAAVALGAAKRHGLPDGARVLVCMDARMHEVYWACYRATGMRVTIEGDEQVGAPESVTATTDGIQFGVGTGWRAYPALRQRYPALLVEDDALPRAIDIADLARPELLAGRGVSAAHAQPVYVRNRVVSTNS